MRLVKLCLVIAVLATAGAALALIPPMPENELQEMADVIADVEVVELKKAGEPYGDHCYLWQNWTATLKILKLYKGRPEKQIVVHYPTRVKNLKDCVGGRTSYSLNQGAFYKLFLKKGPGKAAPYHFLSWSGVRSIKAPPKAETLTPKAETPKP